MPSPFPVFPHPRGSLRSKFNKQPTKNETFASSFSTNFQLVVKMALTAHILSLKSKVIYLTTLF